MAKILVTNDDGVSSKLWSGLCDALEAAGHTVYGVAPAIDYSWCAAGMTLGRELAVEEIGERRWAVTGTPADCVGIALDGLLPEKVELVVSGINCGVNTRLPVILASGTVGAATAASMRDVAAVAASYAMPREHSKAAKVSGGIVPETEATTRAMFAQLVKRVGELANAPKPLGTVVNINFPAVVTAETQWANAKMAICGVERYFVKQENGSWKHEVKVGPVAPRAAGEIDEFAALGKGMISEAVIDWRKIG